MLHQRDHREGTQRPDDAKDESRLSRRPSGNHCETPCEIARQADRDRRKNKVEGNRKTELDARQFKRR
jgi:hypothetical protein